MPKRTTLISIIVLILLAGTAGYMLVTKGVIEDAWYRSQLSRSQEVPKIQQCTHDDECILVQESWCRIVSSIQHQYAKEWTKKDKKHFQEAQSNRQTCKVSSSEFKDVNNFRATCQQGSCTAQFISIDQNSGSRQTKPVCGNGVCEEGENDCPQDCQKVTPIPARETCVPSGYNATVIEVKFKQGILLKPPEAVLTSELKKDIRSMRRLTSASDHWFEITLQPQINACSFMNELKRLETVAIAEFAPLPAPPPLP